MWFKGQNGCGLNFLSRRNRKESDISTDINERHSRLEGAQYKVEFVPFGPASGPNLQRHSPFRSESKRLPTDSKFERLITQNKIPNRVNHIALYQFEVQSWCYPENNQSSQSAHKSSS